MHPDITLQRKSLQRIARRVGLQASTSAIANGFCGLASLNVDSTLPLSQL